MCQICDSPRASELGQLQAHHPRFNLRSRIVHENVPAHDFNETVTAKPPQLVDG